MSARLLLAVMATIACGCGGWPLGGNPDYDGDGLVDSRDRCPREPEDFDGFQDDDGCPERDNDRDGIPDIEDRCPDQAGDPRNGGCPVR